MPREKGKARKLKKQQEQNNNNSQIVIPNNTNAITDKITTSIQNTQKNHLHNALFNGVIEKKEDDLINIKSDVSYIKEVAMITLRLQGNHDLADRVEKNDYTVIPIITATMDSKFEDELIDNLKREMGLTIEDDEKCLTVISEITKIIKKSTILDPETKQSYLDALEILTNVVKTSEDEDMDFDFMEVFTDIRQISKDFPDESDRMIDVIEYIMETGEYDSTDANVDIDSLIEKIPKEFLIKL